MKERTRGKHYQTKLDLAAVELDVRPDCDDERLGAASLGPLRAAGFDQAAAGRHLGQRGAWQGRHGHRSQDQDHFQIGKSLKSGEVDWFVV